MKRIKSFLKNTCLYCPLSFAKYWCKNWYLIIAFYFFYFLKPKPNKIVFCSFLGKQFNAQPKMIFDELVARNIPDLDIVWILSDKTVIPNGFRTVKPRSIHSVFELATAKVWVDNARKDFWIKKKKGQLYIQTWHGPVCLKAVESDCEKTLSPVYVMGAKRDSKNADFLVAETEWRKKNIKNAFWYRGEILEGEFKKKELIDTSKTSDKVKSFYGIKDNEKIVLYVPTFRKNSNLDCYSLDYNRVLNALKQADGADYRFIVRLHPNISQYQKKLDYNDNKLNGTVYPSADELIASADVIISDYSGCIFEGYRANKKVFIFATDIDSYLKEDRKMYFDLFGLPSPVAKTNDELVEIINKFDLDEYDRKRSAFVENVGYYYDDASKLVVNEILKRIR